MTGRSRRRRVTKALAPVLALAPALLVACDGTSPLADGYGAAEVTCTSCHGGRDGPAPPTALDGSDDTSTRGVGAHQAHLRDGLVRLALACDECHVVPTRLDDEGHIDPLPAELRFGALASANGRVPFYDPRDASCSATWCHGDGSSGGAHVAPIWTRVDGSQKTCGSCHGAPPPFPHVPDTRCARCHSDTVSADGRILTAGGRHLDGVVDVDDLDCTSCHGSGMNPAPPAAVGGATDTTAAGVGAHARHAATTTTRHAGIACVTCHIVPVDDGDDGHRDSPLPAELVFSGLALGDGAPPSYDGVGCSNVACHAGSGATSPAPIWTLVDGSQVGCTGCHGAPPPAPHPQSTRCQTCHGVAVDGVIIEPSKHVDGVVDLVPFTCTTCHGQEGSPMPPLDLAGSASTTSPGVGAHLAHVFTDGRAAPVACDECHVVPLTVDAPGHTDDDDGVAEVVFGPLASAQGVLSSSYASLTCSNVACHGGDGASGGTITSPVWNVVDGTQRACGSCHGLPPPPPHPPRADCASCHADVVNAASEIVNGALHVNGVVDLVGAGCVGCHGSDGESAPPVSTTGETSTVARGVGAHRSHVEGSDMFGPVACGECHVVPTTLGAEGHMDTALPAEVKFGPVAETNGVDPWWDGVSCSNVACHGAGLPNEGGLHLNPVWTVVDGSQTTCFSCHGFPPQGTHPQSFSCAECHGAVIAPNATFVRPDLHANGVINFMSAGQNDFMIGGPDAP